MPLGLAGRLEGEDAGSRHASTHVAAGLPARAEDRSGRPPQAAREDMTPASPCGSGAAADRCIKGGLREHPAVPGSNAGSAPREFGDAVGEMDTVVFFAAGNSICSPQTAPPVEAKTTPPTPVDAGL